MDINLGEILIIRPNNDVNEHIGHVIAIQGTSVVTYSNHLGVVVMPEGQYRRPNKFRNAFLTTVYCDYDNVPYVGMVVSIRNPVLQAIINLNNYEIIRTLDDYKVLHNIIILKFNLGIT